MEKQLLLPDCRKRLHAQLDELLDKDIQCIALSTVGLGANGDVSTLSFLEGPFGETTLRMALFSGLHDALMKVGTPKAVATAKALIRLFWELEKTFHRADELQKESPDKSVENVTWH